MEINKNKYLLIITILISLIIRLFFAHLDPYLHEWDERYHALVAENMINHPFIPMLRNKPIVPYELNSWCCNSIWLHKQPLFLWQMALSMKIFGVSVFSMRYPSVIMGVIMILLLFRITFLLTAKFETSIIAAILFCFSYYQLEQISGLIGMDHNDVAFGFYIVASIWAYCEYLIDKKNKWIILIGIFSGLAILNKWLVGLLVYLPWIILTISDFIKSKDLKFIKPIIYSVIICIIVFLPWQLYILYNFKELAMFEYKVNNEHIWNTVQGHSGSFFYYFIRFPKYFGKYIYLFVVFGFVILLKDKINYNQRIKFTLLISFIAVFIFFSFFVKSKLPSYVFIVAPLGFIFSAIFINFLFSKINSNLIKFIIMVVVVYFTLNPNEVIESRKNNQTREKLIYNTNIYQNVRKSIPKDCKVVININSFEDIDYMFYNNDITAYHWWIDEKYLDSLSHQKIKIAAFENHNEYQLPIKYKTYPYLFIIKQKLK